MTQEHQPSPNAFHLPVRVYYADTDAAGIVYHANYLAFMERARTEWLRSKGMDYAALPREHGVNFLVRSVKLDYFAPARPDELLSVTAEVTEFGRSRVHVSQFVLRDGQVLVHGQVNLVCVDIHTGRAAETPAVVRQLMSGEGV